MNSAHNVNKHGRELWASEERAEPAVGPEQRIQLSHTQTWDLEGLGKDKWVLVQDTEFVVVCYAARENNSAGRDSGLLCALMKPRTHPACKVLDKYLLKEIKWN